MIFNYYTYTLKPSNINSHNKYHFELKITYNDGNQQIFPCTLDVGCILAVGTKASSFDAGN